MEAQWTVCPACGQSNEPGLACCRACGGSLTDGAIETSALQRLQDAWEVVRLHRSLRSCGWWSISWGVISVVAGLALPNQAGRNALLMVSGLGLIAAGIAPWRSNDLGALHANAVGLLALGGWSMAVTILNGPVSAALGFWSIPGAFQIVWAILSLRQASRADRVGPLSDALVSRVEMLATHIQRTHPVTSGDVIAFRGHGRQWKVQLAPRMAVLVARGAREAYFVPRETFALTAQQGQIRPGQPVRFSASVGGKTWTGNMSYESWQRYAEWQEP